MFCGKPWWLRKWSVAQCIIGESFVFPFYVVLASPLFSQMGRTGEGGGLAPPGRETLLCRQPWVEWTLGVAQSEVDDSLVVTVFFFFVPPLASQIPRVSGQGGRLGRELSHVIVGPSEHRVTAVVGAGHGGRRPPDSPADEERPRQTARLAARRRARVKTKATATNCWVMDKFGAYRDCVKTKATATNCWVMDRFGAYRDL